MHVVMYETHAPISCEAKHKLRNSCIFYENEYSMDFKVALLINKTSSMNPSIVFILHHVVNSTKDVLNYFPLNLIFRVAMHIQ